MKFLPALLMLILITAEPSSASTAARVNRGNRLYGKEKYQEARELYRQALEGSSDPRIHYNLGNTGFNLNMPEEAEQSYKNAFESGDERVRKKTSYNLGNLNFSQGDLKQAVDNWKKALILNPSDDDARHNLEVGLKLIAEQEQQSCEDGTGEEGEEGEEGEGEEGEEGDEGDEDSDDGGSAEEREREQEKEEARRILQMLDEMEKEGRKNRRMESPSINVEQDW